MRKGLSGPVGAGWGSIDLLIELMSCYLFLLSSNPLVAFGTANGRWPVWTKQQAAASLRAVGVLAGGRAEDYAMHSPRIGAQFNCRPGGLHPRSAA